MGINASTVCAVLLFTAIIRGLLLRRSWFGLGRPLRLPPGPSPLPIIGNLHQVPADYQERTFSRWAKEHGDLIYAKFFTRPVIIINSQEIAKGLLEERGTKYSSRPRLVMMSEIMGLHMNTALLRYDDAHRRKHRRWIQATFGDQRNTQRFATLQQREAAILVDGLMRTPNEYALHVKRYVSALIMESVYGHRIVSLEDEFILLIDRAMEALVATGPAGGTLVDFLPLLKYVPVWVPGMRWKRKALRARDLSDEGKTRPYLMTRDATLSGIAKQSYVSSLVAEAIKGDKLSEEEEDIRESASALYGAGTDTAKTAILTFILAIVLHPDVYRKAQDEVTRVVGTDCLPILADRGSLPYVDSVVKEVYRWNPPIPLGIPHFLTEDDEYRGFDLPKNSTVVANLWSMCQNEYDDPSSFRPERFLNADMSDSEISDPRHIVFGHGRRLCPGRQFGDAAVFLAVVSMIATLNIKKAHDAQGREITPEPRFMSGFVSHPLDFACAIEPRSFEAVKLVADTVTSMS